MNSISSEHLTLGLFANGPKLTVFFVCNSSSLFLVLQQWQKYEWVRHLWSASLGNDSKQRHRLLGEWRCFVCRQRAFLCLRVSWKSDCHYCCYQNTFFAKTMQHSSVQSSDYRLLDRFGCSAAVCCMAFDDSSRPRILRSSEWTAQSVSIVSNGFYKMVVRQFHHHQFWSPLGTLEAVGVPYKSYKERW